MNTYSKCIKCGKKFNKITVHNLKKRKNYTHGKKSKPIYIIDCPLCDGYLEKI